jgi:outer membrane protein assembly factor BamD (BamD/ComL family)
MPGVVGENDAANRAAPAGEAAPTPSASPAGPVSSGGAVPSPGPAAAVEPRVPAGAGPRAGPAITDVWSRTSPKHRRRAIALLIVNLVLFCGLCVFTHWLHSARAIDFSLNSYFEPFRFWGTPAPNLYDFILDPISVDQTPIHGVVIGLLFAAIVAVPISVAILYRFSSAVPFIAAVLVFAHLPWMAITLAASCVLAAVRPFRMSFRFGSALVGMLPVLLYLYLATRGPADPLAASVSPERRLLLAGPWLLAILGACTMMAVIIFIAHLVDYRPGAVAPVIAVMFATPAILFHVHVGVDELHYRVLESTYGPRAERFEPVQDATPKIFALLHYWTMPGLDPEPRRSALLAIWSADPEVQFALKQRITRRLLLDLMDDRREAYEACKNYIADHPASRYVPNVLFIQARTLDTRLDERALVGETAQRELYTDFPHVESEPIWTNLLEKYPHLTLAAAARLHVAQLRLRHGDADGALAALEFQPALADDGSPATTTSGRRWLHTRSPEASLGYEPEQDRFEAARLRELILANRDDAQYGIVPLQMLAGLDQHRRGYRDQLQRLAHRYRDSTLYDNLVVRWAIATSDRAERAAKLRACIARFPDGDALPEAMFNLADLDVQAFGAGDDVRRAGGIARLREIATRFPESCWAQRANERLQILEPKVPPSTQTAVSP